MEEKKVASAGSFCWNEGYCGWKHSLVLQQQTLCQFHRTHLHTHNNASAKKCWQIAWKQNNMRCAIQVLGN